MVHVCGDWYRVYESAMREPDTEQRRALCAQARKLIQDRLVVCEDNSERDLLEDVLRNIVECENSVPRPARPN
jgi:hypothetical protein